MNQSSKPSSAESSAFVPVFYVLCGTSFLCVILLIVRAYQKDMVQYGFLLWNLFLAWLPLIVSMLATGLSRAMKGGFLKLVLLVLGIAWMLLYPNAPYLTTDMMHLVIDPGYDWHQAERSLVVWYDLVVFFLFSWCGLLLGYMSMLHFHTLVRRFAGSAAGWLFVVAASFLGGFGVYLGRVIRLNSWDVLFSPFRLIDGVRAGLDHHGAVFTALFGLLILIVYLSLHALRFLRGSGATAEEGIAFRS